MKRRSYNRKLSWCFLSEHSVYGEYV